MFLNDVKIMQCNKCHENIDLLNNRVISEACGHMKCRHCFIKEEHGCEECTAAVGADHRDSGEVFSNLIESNQFYGSETDVASSNFNKCSTINPASKTQIQIIENVLVKAVEIQLESVVDPVASKYEKNVKKKSGFSYPPHLQIIKNQSETIYLCTICDKEFKSKSNRSYHLYCGNANRKPLKCTKCEKRFITQTHMEYHVRTHLDTNKQFACKMCGKEFLREGSLRKHLKKHNDNSKYICKICKKSFFYRKEFIMHEMVHENRQKPFSCEQCGKYYSNKTNLKQHLLTHTGSYKISCLKCNVQFTRKSSLNTHLLLHIKTFKYKCDVCGKDFAEQRNLNRHLSSHNDTTLFECNLCSIKTSRKDNIKRHIRNIHPNENFDENFRIIVKNYENNMVRSKEITSLSQDIQYSEEMEIATDSNSSTTETNTLDANKETVINTTSVIKFAPASIAVPNVTSEPEVINDNNKIAINQTIFNNNIRRTNVHNELVLRLNDTLENREQSLNNINIYRQLLSPYLKPTENVTNLKDSENTDNAFSVVFDYKAANTAQTDEEIYENSMNDMKTNENSNSSGRQFKNNPNNNDNSTTITMNNEIQFKDKFSKNKEYFSEMHWRKRTSQCFSQQDF